MNLRYVLAIIILIIGSISAAADVDVTFAFNQQNVQAYAYNCQDSTCTNVGTFSGQLPNGQATSNGKLNIRFPATLATPYGYGLFFVSKGFRPMAYKVTLHSNGNTNIFTTNYPIEFSKVPLCTANVQTFSLANTVKKNQPVTITTAAGIDSSTVSAFKLLSNPVGFVPPEIRNEYYSADTRITLQVKKENNVVDQQEKLFSAAQGNSLFADQTQQVSFIHLPREAGDFTASIFSEVVDDQCQSSSTRAASSTFTVLADAPRNSCYTLLRNYTASSAKPKVGEPVTISFEKITNLADSSGSLTTVQTDILTKVKDPNGNLLLSTANTLAANGDTTNPTKHSFSFTPVVSGNHEITIEGKANNIQCSQNSNTLLTNTLFVEGNSQTFIITVSVRDVQGNPIGSASVAVGSLTGTTESTGRATISNIQPGTHTLAVSAIGFSTYRQPVPINNNLDLAVVLTGGNTSPIFFLPNNLTIAQGLFARVDLAQVTQDAEDDEQKINYTAFGTANIQTLVNEYVLTITPAGGFTGRDTIKILANDSSGLTATGQIIIIVPGPNTPPAFLTLPRINVTQNTALFRAIYLSSFAADLESHASDLSFAIVSTTDSRAGATISADKALNIQPSQDFNGLVTLTLNVSDGQLSSQGTLQINISAVNQPPRLVRAPNVTIINATTVRINFTDAFIDQEGDSMFFIVSPVPTIEFIIDTINKLIFAHANRPFSSVVTNITASDGKLNTTISFPFSFFTGVLPVIFPSVPNITVFGDGEANSLDLSAFENDAVDGSGGDNNNLKWTITGLNISLVNFTFSHDTDVLIVQGVKNVSGNNTVNLTLTNSRGFTANQTIVIQVTGVNHAPLFTNLANATAIIGRSFAKQINASDIDVGDKQTFNSTISIINATGFLNFTPATLGNITLNLTVCDLVSICTSGSFTLNVIDNLTPSILNTTKPLDSIFTLPANYTFTINLSDNGPIANITFALNSQPLNVSNSSLTGIFSASVLNLTPALHNFTWVVIDTFGNTNTTTQNFTIAKANASLTIVFNSGIASILQNNNVTINATLTPTFNFTSNATIKLFVNGTLVSNGSSTLSVNQTPTLAGILNITAVFDGDELFNPVNSSTILQVNDTTPPVVQFVVSPANGTIFSATQITTFNATVTDNLRVDRVVLEFNLINFTMTNVSTSLFTINFTGISSGNHSFKIFANDTSSNRNVTIAQNYTVVISNVTQLKLLLNNLSSNITADVKQLIIINASIITPANETIFLFLDSGAPVLNGTGTINSIVNLTVQGIRNVTVAFFGNQNFTAQNLTFSINLTDISAPSILINTPSPATPVFAVNQTYNFSANITDNVQVDTVIVELNGVNNTNISNASNVFSFATTNLAAGTHTIKFFANDSGGRVNVSAFNYTINKSTPNLTLILNITNNNLTISENSTIPINVSITDPSKIIELYEGAQLISNSTAPYSVNRTFTTPGQFNITALFNGDQNFTKANQSFTVRVLDITAPNITNITLSPSSPVFNANLSYNFSAKVFDNVALNNVIIGVDLVSGGNGTLQNVNITNNTVTTSFPALGAGDHLIVFFANDTSGNFNVTIITPYNVIAATPTINVTVRSGNISLGEITNISCSANTPLSVQLTRNGTNVSNPDVSLLDVGAYTYSCFNLPNSNFTNLTMNTSLTVNKLQPNITFTINGQTSNITVNVNTTATIFGAITAPSGVITLFENSQSLVTAASVTFTKNFTQAAVNNYTLTFAGTQNFSSFNRTISVTALDLGAKINFTPASGSHLNQSFFFLSFATVANTSCRFALTDEDFTNMNTSFNTSTGNSHNGTVSGLSLGINTVSVSCTNDTAATNTDLSYNVTNIIENSTFANSTAFNSIIQNSVVNVTSQVNQSRVNSSRVTNTFLVQTNTTNSTVLNSILTRCTVRNAFVKNFAASDCTIVGGIIDPPEGLNQISNSNITGNSQINSTNVTNSSVDSCTIILSDITGSIVSNCGITNSTVSNSNVSTANVTRSTLTNSRVTNSNVPDATLISAVVTNNVLTGGTIIFNGTTYNASLSGSKHLSNLTNFAPTAAFTSDDAVVNVATQFTSQATDANIPGELNDTLTHFWVFGDGTNSTQQSPSKTYSSAGTFTVNYTVTDKFGQVSTVSKQVLVGTGSSSTSSGTSGGTGTGGSAFVISGGGGGGGGGGSRGGSGGRVQTISLTQPRTINVRTGDVYKVQFKGQDHTITMQEIKKNQAKVVIASKSEEFTLNVGNTAKKDFDEDGFYDVGVTLERSISSFIAVFRFEQLNERVPFKPVTETTQGVESVEIPEETRVQEERNVTQEQRIPVTAVVKEPISWLSYVLLAVIIILALAGFFIVRKITE